MDLVVALIVYVIAAAIGMYVLYWVIRLAVRGGIHDAKRPRVERSTTTPPPATPAWMSKDA